MDGNGGTSTTSKSRGAFRNSPPAVIVSAKPALDERAPAGLTVVFAQAVFRILIVDERGRELLALGSYRDDEVVAVWRRLSDDSGLPLLVAGSRGGFEPVYPQLGRLRLGPAARGRDPRALAVLSGRRPRFLVRRKAGRLPGRPCIHRERELAGGRGC